MKLMWWYCKTNGMVGQYRKSPGNNWIGPFETLRELKEATKEIPA